MATLKFQVAHALSKDEAKKRVDKLLTYWKSKYGVTSRWNGDTAEMSGKVMKIDLTASLAVTDSSVTGEATDPGFLLREPARNYLNKKFQAYLNPNAEPAQLSSED
jgi:hypothetical protein